MYRDALRTLDVWLGWKVFGLDIEVNIPAHSDPTSPDDCMRRMNTDLVQRIQPLLHILPAWVWKKMQCLFVTFFGKLESALLCDGLVFQWVRENSSQRKSTAQKWPVWLHAFVWRKNCSNFLGTKTRPKIVILGVSPTWLLKWLQLQEYGADRKCNQKLLTRNPRCSRLC